MPKSKNKKDTKSSSEIQPCKPVQSTLEEDLGEAVLVVKNLKKRYGKSVSFAADGIGFEVFSGEIVGIVGTNGAGKSTTIKSITGFLPFDEGQILICGKDIAKCGVEAKQCFGYVPDDRAVFEKMTGLEYLNFVADIRRVPQDVREKRIAELEQNLKLGAKIYNLISSYSHGMRQKICLMASLIHLPKLWILDEPMTGLDPQTTASLKLMMLKYKSAGNAVLFSSHNLDVVEKICDRVIIILNGKKVLDMTVKQMKQEFLGTSFEDVFLSFEEE